MKFTLYGVEYGVNIVRGVTGAAILEVETTLRKLFGVDSDRLPVKTWGSIEAARKRLSRVKSVEEFQADPDWVLVTVANIWQSRRAAGEKVTFSECMEDVDFDDVLYLDPDDPEPEGEDETPGKDQAAGDQPPTVSS